MDKYYFRKTSSVMSRNWTFLIRYNPNLWLEVEEDINTPYISLYIDKLDLGNMQRPKGTKYEKVREIAKETFDSSLKAAFKSLKKLKWDSAEYFLIASDGYIDIAMYTNDNMKLHIGIDIRSSIDGLSVVLHCGRSYTRRPGYRKNGILMKEEIFVAILKHSMKFVEEQESYQINMGEYEKRINSILAGNIPGDVPEEESVNVEQLIEQLENRKSEITARLIENDSDTESQRTALRGEKEGVEYSLRAIRKFFRLVS